MTVEVGSEAPDFTLNDYNKQAVKLSSFQGEKPVLLVFYPFAFSGICTGELCQLRDEFADYDGNGVQVIGVSVDTPFSLKAWAEKWTALTGRMHGFSVGTPTPGAGWNLSRPGPPPAP